jgi:response regulator RpfG family c-di-GMP phosphodiesterase
MKIVLVDENRETYEVLNEVAKLSGSEIVYFDDLENAKAFILESVNDIDGVIVEKYVKNLPSGQLIAYFRKENVKIPFILLTENVNDEEKEYFKELGITEIIEKPFNPLDVMGAVVEYLSKEKGREYVESRLETDKTDRSTLKAIVEKIINFLKNLFKR